MAQPGNLKQIGVLLGGIGTFRANKYPVGPKVSFEKPMKKECFYSAESWGKISKRFPG